MAPDLASLREQVIDRHPWWLSKKKGSGLQQFVFNRADRANHRVCIVLQSHGRRLYSSFPDAIHFWNYYAAFKGKRCFYWINRSFVIPGEVSLLHLDIEWWSQKRDTLAEKKITAICSAINEALPKPVAILKDNLSRKVSQNKFKNYWHLYPQITMAHNAQGCIHRFVKRNIWDRLKVREDMVDGSNNKPIIDLSIYTKNRLFRVSCSSKWVDDALIPMPTQKFFMDTRLADRYQSSA